MSDAPERIWLEDWAKDASRPIGYSAFSTPVKGDMEYIRADLVADWCGIAVELKRAAIAASDEARALRAEVARWKKVAGRWKETADRYETALVARHGGEPIALLSELDEARAEVERLREERDAAVNARARWAQEVERMRAAIKDSLAHTNEVHAARILRAALESKHE